MQSVRSLSVSAVSLIGRVTLMNSLFPRVDRVRAALLGGVLLSSFALPLAAQAGSVTRTSSWTYTAEGLIESETIEPDMPEFSVTTTYSYDAYGNKVGSVTSGSAAAPTTAQFPPRSSSVTMDAKGRFATKATAGLDGAYAPTSLTTSEDRTFLSGTGAPATQTGPNGLTSSWGYDSFGRKILEKTPLTIDSSGTVIGFAKGKTEYLWCSGVNGGTAVCPADAKYLVRSKAMADNEVDYLGPVSTIFFDILDREIRRTTEEMSKVSGSWVVTRILGVDSAYDAQGRPSKKSEPFDLTSIAAAAATSGANAPVWDHYQYDLLGRVVREYQDVVGTADPATTGKQRVVYKYEGLSTKSLITRDLQPDPAAMRMAFVAPGPLTDKSVQIRTTTKNSQGQVISVTEGSGTLETNGSVTENGTHTAVLYTYDGFSNLTTTVVQGHDAADITTTVAYDQRGRKTSMSDPDKGTWTYEYNAIGELFRQTDAKQQVVTTEYDLLSRTTRKISKLADGSIEKTDTWTFGIAAAETAKGEIGKLKTATSYAGIEDPANEVSFKSINYDALGRSVGTVQRIAGVMSGQTATYEEATGRLKKVILPSGQVLGYAYDDTGTLKKLTQGEGGSYAYWTAGQRNARGQMLDFKLGNDVVTQRTYSRARGFLLAIKSGRLTANDVQDLSYEWDNLGILTKRTMDGGAAAGGYDEVFEYDELRRLIGSTVSNANPLGTPTATLSYDGHGNILSKSGVGNYTYGGNGAGPHAVTSLDTGESFNYDPNGNLTLSAGGTGPSRSVTWTGFNMPAQISGTRATLDFIYDDAGNRIRQVNRAKDAEQQLSLKTTKYYFGDAFGGNRSERTVTHTAGDVVTWTDQLVIGGEMVATIETPDANPNNRTVKYMHSDHLGSVQTVTSGTAVISNGVTIPAGTVLEKLDYDPWGQRRFGGTVGGSYAGDIDTLGSLFGIQTDRGFTGHEMLDDVGLIHMNGRIYDARLARFLSADPFIQDNANSQAYNRYSYVSNNPLAATDPSGYFLSKLFKSIGKFFKKFGKQILSFVITVIGYVLAPYTGGMSIYLAGMVNGFISGGWKGAMFAALSAGAGGGGIFGVVAQAAIGCASAAAGGGSCQAGALSAGFSAAAGSFVNVGNDFFAGMAKNAVIGGTASVIGGGKFANGAMSSAFGYASSGAAQVVASALSSAGQAANDNSAAASKNREPDGVSDYVRADRELGIMTVGGDTLAGQIVFNCRAEASYCSDAISRMNGINGEYGKYKINILFREAREDEVGQVDLTTNPEKGDAAGSYNWPTFKIGFNGPGSYERVNGVLNIDLNSIGMRGLTFHEAGHMLGLQHSWNSTGNLMSYAEEVDRFKEVEVERLIKAYGRYHRL